MYQFQKFVHPLFGSNSYVIQDDNRSCIIIDPTDITSSHIIGFIESNNLKPICIVNTHGHYDHISGDELIRDYFKIPLFIHKDEIKLISNPNFNLSIYLGKSMIIEHIDKYLNEGEEIMSFKILHMPGHTPGSICLKSQNLIVVGDLVFLNSIGRIDLPLSSESDMRNSLKKLLNYVNEDTMFLPGHGSAFRLEDLERENEILWSFINY